MMDSDAFSHWLGVSVDTISLGSCQLSLTVSEQMLNGFQIAHGGISYSLADSALAFAANSHGFKAVSIETSISHVKKVELGERLTAYASEMNRSRKIGIYEVQILNAKNEKVALFKGIVSFSESTW